MLPAPDVIQPDDVHRPLEAAQTGQPQVAVAERDMCRFGNGGGDQRGDATVGIFEHIDGTAGGVDGIFIFTIFYTAFRTDQTDNVRAVVAGHIAHRHIHVIKEVVFFLGRIAGNNEMVGFFSSRHHH